MENREGFTHLIVESDSKLLIDMVTWSCKLNGHTPILVRRIQDLAILLTILLLSTHGAREIDVLIG